MCGRIIQSSGPLHYAFVDGMNVRDTRVHNYPPRWNAAPSQELPEIASSTGIDMAAIDVHRILNYCRPSERVLFEQQMHGATTQEIARKQGVTETAIRIRLLRARRATRSRLEKRASQLQDRYSSAQAVRDAA